MASLCLTCPAIPPAVNIGTEASPAKVQIPDELENRFDSCVLDTPNNPVNEIVG